MQAVADLLTLWKTPMTAMRKNVMKSWCQMILAMVFLA
jgi:uncharacterized protein YecA (UPF0149 family)